MKTEILKGHDYHFIGRVGSFCPVKDGYGGGILVREKDGEYHAATGSKDKMSGKPYRWLEAEMVKELRKEDDIDRSYYNALVDAAIDEISKYGDFEMFVSDEVMDDMNWLEPPDVDKEEIPFEECMNYPA